MALQTTSGFVVATFIVIAACPAHAQDAVCDFVKISTDPNLNLTLGHISSKATRVHFIKDGLPGCPDRTPVCADKAYLVPGDRLILSTRHDVFICATYVNAKRNARVGWLPADAVAYDVAKPAALTDWVGEWSYDEADISVKVGKTGTLLIRGSATFGARNPDRAKRGAVNVGEMKGEVAPTGDRLSFAVGNADTLPVDKGEEFDCKVWMRRLGPWLIVDDNDNCGGLNVTFRGFYTRKP